MDVRVTVRPDVQRRKETVNDHMNCTEWRFVFLSTLVAIPEKSPSAPIPEIGRKNDCFAFVAGGKPWGRRW